MNRRPRISRACAAALAASATMAAAQPVQRGAYLEFDGVDDAVISRADFETQQVTLEAWVRVDDTDPLWATGLISWGSRDQGSYEFCVGPPDQRRLCFFINYNNGQHTLHGSTQLEFGQWYFVAATYDGEVARIYVNAEPDAEAAFNEPIKQTDDPAHLSIGDDFPGASEVLDGAIDQVTIWGEARSADQIYDDMMGDSPRDDGVPMARYTFDEFGSNLVIDHSGNGRHAHLGLYYDTDAEDPAQAMWGEGNVRTRFMLVSSSLPGELELITGDPAMQMHCINGCFTQAEWAPIINRHADLHQRGQFLCDGSLEGPYVDTETFLTGADEVTRHNCESAFYKFEFQMPSLFECASIYGIANADDMGVAFLNGGAISPLITQEDIDNLGLDRVDAAGHPLLGWPTADPLYSLDCAMFRPGMNELIVAVGSDFSQFEPAGLEFLAMVRYECLADWNGDGDDNTMDFLDFLNDWNARLPEADVNGDGRIDTLDVLEWLNAWAFGCPGA